MVSSSMCRADSFSMIWPMARSMAAIMPEEWDAISVPAGPH